VPKQPFFGWKEKMNQRRWIAVLLAITLMIGLTLGCSPKKSINQPATPVTNPLTVEVTVDDPLATSADISTAGGTLTAQGADGARFTLTFPAGALLNDERITITPVSKIDGLPFSGGLAGAVQMAPEGLRLLLPATLTIESPKTAAATGFETVAFAYHRNGEGLFLNPSDITGNRLTVEVWHFCGMGAVQGTSAEIQTQQQKYVPSNAEDAFTQRIQEYIGRERQAELLGTTPDPAFIQRMEGFSREAYDSFIGPQLPTALKDCAAAPGILSRAIGWVRQVQLLYHETKFKAEQDKVLETWNQAYVHCRRYQASGQNGGAAWSGTVCSLARPFTLTAATAEGLDFPFNFVPDSTLAGTASYDVNGFGTHWTGSGPYSVQESGSPMLSLMVQIQNGCATTPSGQYCQDQTMQIDLTPLDFNGCGGP
jgi:hypothetical protein